MQNFQFDKSEFNLINDLFLNFFSKDKSPFEFFVRIRLSPKSIPDSYLTGPQANYAEWDIFLHDTQLIGIITYNSGPEIDNLLFEYDIDSSKFIQLLIDNIKYLMRNNNFSIIEEHSDLFDSQELKQAMDKSSSLQDLSNKDWDSRKTTLSGDEFYIPKQPITPEEIDNLLTDIKLMKKFHKDYNPLTAKLILEKIPIAWKNHNLEGGKWGPSFVAELCNIEAETVNRYLRAFYCAGLRVVNINGYLRDIPYTIRKPCPEIHI